MSQEERNTLGEMDESSPDQNQLKDFEKEERALVAVNELKDGQKNYKSLLIVNESADTNVILYIYSGWSPLCITSTISKIIQPKQKYFYREKSEFKFQLIAQFKDKEKKDDKQKNKDLLGLENLNEDQFIKITESLECKQENLANFPNEKRACLRKIHREKELATAAGALNLYEILGLEMDKVRKLESNAAKKAIKKAYHIQIRIWHPDKNFGDSEIAMQIIVAKEILMDDVRRASYHNGIDYDKGWFSSKRWNAIFWPESCTEKQNTAFWRRIYMSGTSIGIAVGGAILTASTAGTATPLIAMCGAIFGAGFTVAGGQSLMHTVTKESVVDGCEVKKWAQEAGKGFVIGAVTGGVAAAYAAAAVATAAEVEVAATVGEEAAECTCIAMKTKAEGLAIDAAEAVPGRLLETAKETTTDIVTERLDDSVENKAPIEHVRRGIKNLVFNATVGAAMQGFDAIKGTMKGKFSNEQNIAASLCQVAEQEAGISQQFIESGTEEICGKAAEVIKGYLDEPDSAEHGKRGVQENKESSEITDKVEELADESFPGVIKYRLTGDWFSKMIVTFTLNGKKSENEVSGDGTRIHIPADATNIDVRFKVSRPHWGYIMKYDRFAKTWSKPNEPHIFRYERPPIRTFTVSGNLWWEAVMRVSDEYHEETNEMS